MKELDNRKKSRVVMAVIGILVFVIAAIVFLKLNKTANTGDVEISYLMGAFVIDYEDLNAVAGDADHVFVGKVESEDGTEYRDYVTVETGLGGTKEIGNPYTKAQRRYQ